MLGEKISGYVEDSCNTAKETNVKPKIKYYSILNLINVILLAAVYTFVILKAYIGAITVGAIFIQINSIMRLYEAMGNMLQQYNLLKVACGHFKHSITYFNLPEMNKEGTRKISVEETKNCVLELKNVSFKYPDTDNLVLDNITLSISPGEKLAVVGMNGAGKTTMIKLLCRLYEPTEGTITLNGTDIREYDFDDYIKLFSVVFQDFTLFAFDLAQNVAADSGINNNKLEECLVHSGLENVAGELKGDYEVAVGKNFDENGRDFSGGAKQKIAIARALYKDAPVVILDEPTAALDPITEYEIYKKFDTLTAKKTSVFISHRLSSCRFCSKIAVFDKGKIVQLGSHDELVKQKNGKYFELWDAQAKHYIAMSPEDERLV